MGSYDYCETCIMLVFLVFVPDLLMMFATCWWTSGVNFGVAMRCQLCQFDLIYSKLIRAYSPFGIHTHCVTVKNGKKEGKGRTMEVL
jgi:hypothetical protein